MPLLKFWCRACGETFEAFHRLKAVKAGEAPCPLCGNTQTEPVQTPFEETGNETRHSSQIK